MFDFKNADKKSLDREFTRIARESNDDRFFTSKELKHLQELLLEGEQVLAFTSGLMAGDTWLIALTDKRVLFLDAGSIYGLEQIEIDLDKVNAVTSSTRWWFGDICIAHGSGEHKIEEVNKKSVRKFTLSVRQAIEARKFYRYRGARGMPHLVPGGGSDTVELETVLGGEPETVELEAEPGGRPDTVELQNTQGLSATVRNLASSGEKIAAIKALRDEEGGGLRKAKKRVDAFLLVNPPVNSAEAEDNGCLGVIVLFVIVLGLYFFFS